MLIALRWIRQFVSHLQYDSVITLWSPREQYIMLAHNNKVCLHECFPLTSNLTSYCVAHHHVLEMRHIVTLRNYRNTILNVFERPYS